MKIRPEGWILWTLVRQLAIEACGIDLDSHEVVALSIWLVESMPIYSSRIHTYSTKSMSKLNSSEVETRSVWCHTKIDSAIMFERKVKLSPSVFLAHAKVLENSTAKYPIRQAVCKTVTIPDTFRDINVEKLLSGQIPSRLVIRLVPMTHSTEHTTEIRSILLTTTWWKFRFIPMNSSLA